MLHIPASFITGKELNSLMHEVAIHPFCSAHYILHDSYTCTGCPMDSTITLAYEEQVDDEGFISCSMYQLKGMLR